MALQPAPIVPARSGHRSLRLADLAPGAVAVIEHVDETSPLGRRLLDLGLVPETRITLRRRAPLGDPLEFELRGYRLCLRRTEAREVRVRQV
jgi:Fe2+ transport system protein FeoA